MLDDYLQQYQLVDVLDKFDNRLFHSAKMVMIWESLLQLSISILWKGSIDPFTRGIADCSSGF